MTQDEFNRTGEAAYGLTLAEGWPALMAADLACELDKAVTTEHVTAWRTGEKPVPEWMEEVLSAALRRRADDLQYRSERMRQVADGLGYVFDCDPAVVAAAAREARAAST